MMSLQHQLQNDYHIDKYRRDRLMSSIDIPHTQNALRDRTPGKSHKLINRVASGLPTRKGSLGAEAHAGHHEDIENVPDMMGDMYRLGERYGGYAKRQVEKYGIPRNQSNSRPNVGGYGGEN